MIKKFLTVKVTQQNIDEGTPADGHNCPIARAIKAQSPSIEQVSVGRIGGCFSETTPTPGEPKYTAFNMSEAARKFTIDFDSGLEVKPSVFRLPTR